MKRAPSIVFCLPLVMLALVVACGGKVEPPSDAAAPVKVAAAAPGPVVEWIELFGRVVPPPDRDATIAPQVAGVLLAVAAREGQDVRAGDVMARVDPAPLRDALAAAEAAQRRAASEASFRRRAAERTRGLFEKGIASRQEAETDEAAADAAEAALTEASSALATARRRAAWAELRAPLDGVVVHVMRHAGDTVDGSPATPVLQIAARTPVQVAADATAEALARVIVGQRAEVSARGADGAPRRASVLQVARAVDAATGAGEVRLALEDAGAPFVLGASVVVRVAVREQARVLTVPAAALRRGPGGATEVVVVQGTRAAVRTVAVGIADGENVEITSGLEAGERVVVDDPVGLADGARVSVRP